jgi:hypothetical protein
MATALIHMDAKQKARLTRRAKLRGKSFSQEVRDAVDLYLEIPAGEEEEIKLLAREANRAADRMIKRLDATIDNVDRTLRQIRKAK